MNVRKLSGGDVEVWVRWESDRVRVRLVDGTWRMVGSYVGGIYSPSVNMPRVAKVVENTLRNAS